MIQAGARILECACGPCIGIGQSPPTDGVSLRTFNRNFKGRSGTESAKLYLSSPHVAAVSALEGKLADPRSFGKPPRIDMPVVFPLIDHLFVSPSEHPETVEVMRGPNIKPLPKGRAMPETLEGEVLIRLGDDITTDDIMPAGAHIMSLRSNIPAISEYVFSRRDSGFVKRAKDSGGGFIVAGKNYGQGSSREHAAIAPMVLGVKGVIARSFARIHRANLINFGIVPMTFVTDEDLEGIDLGDHIVIDKLVSRLIQGGPVPVLNSTRGRTFEVRIDVDDREKDVLVAGGLLRFTRQQKS
jgi:aconitate hydratase